MMSKEECEKALEHLIECKQRKLCDKCKFKLRCTMSNDELVINQLIEEHFELLNGIERIINKAKELSNSNDELKGLYFITPYKLEDLKEDMWVYDIKYDEFCRIDFIAGIYPHRSYSDGTCEDGAFEENRFYPPQMANMINIEKKGKETMKATINFYGSNSIEYNLKLIDIRCDDRYVYIATSDDEGEAFPKEDVESIEITKF